MLAQEKAYAKLNLSLDVLGRLENGYHEMRMVMQSCSLADDVSIELKPGQGAVTHSTLGYLPEDEQNLATRAALAFFEAAGIECLRAEITLSKRIPVCAGLGGGSSDAAAVLRALDKAFGSPLGRDRLEALGAELGSDVPYCVAGGTALATGRGEILRPLRPLPDCRFVIVKPRFSVSTPELFRVLDGIKTPCHPDTDGMLCAIESGDLAGVAVRMFNVFEGCLGRSEATVREIKGALLDLGANGVSMSGTGSAVFGLFTDSAAAERAHEALSAEWRECFLAEPVSSVM